LGICIELYQLIYLDIPDLKPQTVKFSKYRYDIFREIPATKTDMIISDIEIAYVSNAWPEQIPESIW